MLAAGRGTRLRPLTELRPKVLCPVNNLPLLDLNLAQVAPLAGALAVNAHHLRGQIEAHLRGRDVHLSIEEPQPLETAGALGLLREWIAGRPVLVANGDAWRDRGPDALVDRWDGETVRLLVVHDPDRGDFGPWRFAGASLLPAADVERLQPVPASLYEEVWMRARDEDRLELVEFDGRFFDCGTPAEYLAANLAASGGGSVVAPDAVVEGEVVRSVVWPGGFVAAGERLVDAIRAGTRDEPITVEARR